MEKRGQINTYEPWKRFGEKEVYTINLTDGVTPFMAFFNGKEFNSLMYRLRKPVLVTVTHAWYRPGLTEFSALTSDVKNHVLNAGLLCAELSEAVTRQIQSDPVRFDWDYKRFQAWCLEVYLQRLPSQ